jgi:hypothetical protein
MPAYPPGRPPTERDSLWVMNGSPIYLGTITATAATNNYSTAVPFNQTPLGPATPPSGTGLGTFANMSNTLAGKLLLLQPSAAGLILPSMSPSLLSPNPIVALQTVIPPLAGTVPGVALAAGERVTVLMLPTEGWLQFLPLTGTASLFVWELR